MWIPCNYWVDHHAAGDATCCIIVLAFYHLANGILLMVVGLTEDMHNKHFLILCVNMVNDTLLNLAFAPSAIFILVINHNDFNFTADVVLRVLSCFEIMLIMVQICMTGVLSFER